jgi:multicomponent Na+:H+ antiporter subunit B
MKNKVLITVTRFILPFIIAFSFYIQINGSNAPGGGFQAGVIMASAFMLYSIVFGYRSALTFMPFKALKILAILGIMLYGGTGIACMIMGGEFLNYNMIRNNLTTGQMLGISVIEWGVGLTVFATFSLGYYAFITRGGNEHNID